MIENLYEHIIQAKREAMLRGINANVVAINEKLVFTRLQTNELDVL